MNTFEEEKELLNILDELSLIPQTGSITKSLLKIRLQLISNNSNDFTEIINQLFEIQKNLGSEISSRLFSVFGFKTEDIITLERLFGRLKIVIYNLDKKDIEE